MDVRQLCQGPDNCQGRHKPDDAVSARGPVLLGRARCAVTKADLRRSMLLGSVHSPVNQGWLGGGQCCLGESIVQFKRTPEEQLQSRVCL